MDCIKTGRGKPGTMGEHLRWAKCGEYRIVAYAQTPRAGEGGGYSAQWFVEGIGWTICEEMPGYIERALCAALALPCDLDDAWTVADILAREG